MLDKIIHFSIHNKFIVGLFTAALIAWGTYSLTRLPIDAVPDITNNQVQVITASPSLAAQEVERLITFPIELTMATIPGTEEIRSMSRFGLSVVTIVFKDNIDVYWARQQVSERLREAESQIPAGVGKPELAPVTTGLGEIYQYVIFPKKGYEKKYSAMELRTIQDWIVRRQLLGTPGVADVSSFGGYLKQYEIALNPDRLRSMGVSVTDIFTALQDNNQNTGGAYIDKRPNAYFIRSEGVVKTLTDIEKIVVKNSENGTPVLIRDLASVQYGHAVRYGAMTRNQQGEVVGAIVLMLKGENSSQVIQNVKARIAQIEKTLPVGVGIDPFLDRTTLVNRAVHTVTRNLLEGALIVIFVLILFLGNVRSGLVVASVIPLAMLFAVSLMNLFGVSGNLMSLGAIDFGLIVDGAVIIVESVVHRITSVKGLDRLDQPRMDEEVYQAAARIRSSAAFGEIIILIVYLPILALTGIEGKMFRPMAQTVAFAILGAFILSLTYVPMMSALVLSKKTQQKRNFSDRMMDFFHRLYSPIIGWALRAKAVVIGAALAMLVVAFAGFSRMGGEFIPTLDEGDFAVETRLLTGSSLSETVEVTHKAAAILLRKFPEVREVVGKIGASEIPTDPMPIEACDLMIILKDREEWTSAESREELAEKMAKALEAIPGVTFGFQQPIQMRFNELISGARQDVAVKIFGEDMDVLAAQAGKLGRLVRSVEGAQDVYVERVSGLPQIVVTFNRDRIAKYGLNIAEMNRIIRTAFAGESAGNFYDGEKRFDLVVRLDTANRRSIQDVRNLYVSVPARNGIPGEQIPLSQVAQIEFQEGPNQIQREDAQRRITVGFNVRGRDVESLVKELQQKVDTQLKLPTGYHVTYGGQFENLIEAKGRLSVAVPIALALIFILLFFTFNSVSQSLLIFTAIPLSAIGGVFALWLRDMPFSISAGVGFIALFGVAVLNGIVLIGEFNHLKAEGVKDMQERIRKGTSERLRPVLMTASVASLGFLPMALSTSAGAEVQKPLATVVIGGLITATLLTLVVLPVLYSLEEKWFNREKSKSSGNRARKATLGVGKTLLLLLLLVPMTVLSQDGIAVRTVTIGQALDLAAQNNGLLRSAGYQVAEVQALKRTAVDLGKTGVSLTYGQYNSLYRDNNFTLTQTFAFPTLYGRQRNLNAAQVSSSQLQRDATRNELIRNVRSTYYQLAYAQAVLKLLAAQDSVYFRFSQAAQLRLKTGETNQLENVVAQSQLMELRSQLVSAQANVRISSQQLQTLLNESVPVGIPDTVLTKLLPNPASDSSWLDRNPRLASVRQQSEVSRRTIDVERAKLLPDITLGYFNQSLTGTQTIDGQERYFDRSYRFQGIQAGLAIPLWFIPQQARIQSARIGQQVAESTYQYVRNQLRGEYATALERVRQAQNSLGFYEQSGLPQSDLLLTQAEKNYRAGEIDYLAYAQLLGRAFTIRSSYLRALRDYNQAIIDLEFITGI